MTSEQHYVLAELAEAYRILREAYHHAMGREPPALNPLQERVQHVLAQPITQEKT